MSDEITPARVIRENYRWAPAVLTVSLTALGIGLVVVLVGWLAAGWFQSHNIQRNYSNTVSSQPYQQSLLAQMQVHVTNISGPGGLAATRTSVPANSPEQQVLRAQELNEISSLCSESVNFVPGIAPGSQQFESIVTANCLAGTPVSVPPLADPVPAGS